MSELLSRRSTFGRGGGAASAAITDLRAPLLAAKRCAPSPSAELDRRDADRMVDRFVDPDSEAAALRRAALLLERTRRDSGECDDDLATIEAGVAAMRRAAAAGRLIHESAVEGLRATLARMAPRFCPPHGTIAEIIRFNALAETRELVARLGRARTASAQRRSSRPHHAAT